MNDLVRYSPFSLSRADRNLARAVQLPQQRAAIEAARIDGLALVAETALMRAAQLSAVESMLIQAVPLAEPRLRTIGDSAALAMAIVVQQAVRTI